MVHIFTFFSFSPIFCFSNIFVHIFTFVLLFFVFILIFTCCSKLLLCLWITCLFDFCISSFNFFENNFTCVLHIVSHVHICFCIFFHVFASLLHILHSFSFKKDTPPKVEQQIQHPDPLPLLPKASWAVTRYKRSKWLHVQFSLHHVAAAVGPEALGSDPDISFPLSLQNLYRSDIDINGMSFCAPNM